MYGVKRRVFEFLIYRYQQHKATRAERDLVDRWYDALDREDLPTGHLDESQLWDRIQSRIATPSFPRTISISNGIRWTAAVAASLLICAGILFWNKDAIFGQNEQQVLVKPSYRIFETGVGQRKRVLLADGSNVILNARTQLKVDTLSFGRKDRVVELLAGEAFFEVRKDAAKAFIVKTQELQTTVLGTSFTVKNYAELDEISVSVFTGRVKVAGSSNLLGVLKRGQEIHYSKNSHQNKQHSFDLTTRNSWTEGRTYLRQSDFAELALAVKNSYGIELEAANGRVARQLYTMPISRQLSWPATLESIRQIHHNRSRKEGNKVIIY
ncbi:fec operon regulator FecR [Sphingobacterium thalpophilum]|uniref:Fec operon regulator FecR n=1 Tax=Sphingobacterium thalpophilum TaxID=259 RepID=A0A4U9VEZ2_9SPHI|nr:fec operon regulator FecR [Sphingobacterium thalpophilum]